MGSTLAHEAHEPIIGLTRALTQEEEARAVELHASSLVVDTCGAVQPRGAGSSLKESIADVRAGGVHCIGITLAADVQDFRATINQLDWWNRKIREYSRELVLVTSADEIRQAREDDRIAVFYLLQNGKPFEDEPGYVELFRRMGVTSSAITYNHRNFLGDGHNEPSDAGLSLMGRKMIAEMNRVGMLVDLSHAGSRTQQDAIRASKRPVYFSHCNVRAVFDNDRHATDETLGLLAENGGMLSVMAYEIGEQENPTVADMMNHLDHAASVLGENGLGLATDYPKFRDTVYRTAHLDEEGCLNVQFDGTLRSQQFENWGGPGMLPEYPWFVYARGARRYSEYPNLTRELVVRGYSDGAIRKILGGNFVRLYSEVVG